MKLFSTGNHRQVVSFLEGVQNAFPEDRGLYFPVALPECSTSFLEDLPNLSFPEIANYISQLWLGDEIPEKVISDICFESFNFPVPIHELDSKTYVLELFQGPTMAFKDFGARFMAKVLAWSLRNSDKKIIVLTATSGDTGGAVASGFAGLDQVEVVILFPEGKVSPLQRRQLTTMGSNIHAISIKGNFDDCQRLVKEALVDDKIRKAAQFCSANSINIARLLPQSFYYFYAYGQLPGGPKPLIFSVPSGNFGNLTAGILAYKMGLPVQEFIAATNENDSVPRYLNTGEFHPHPSLETLATAMDVGNPSNFVRLEEIFQKDYKAMGALVKGIKVSDLEIRKIIKAVYQERDYILDPHTAVGLKALYDWRSKNDDTTPAVVLGTAHPSKFPETVEKELAIKLELPDQLKRLLNKEEVFDGLSTDFQDFKQFLLEKVLFL